jgi:hypothetical protein
MVHDIKDGVTWYGLIHRTSSQLTSSLDLSMLALFLRGNWVTKCQASLHFADLEAPVYIALTKAI